MKRRNFIKSSAVAGFGMAMAPSLTVAQNDKANIGFIGVGGRGRSHLRNLLYRDDINVPAICDIDPEANDKTLQMISEKGLKKPTVYSDNRLSFLDMLEKEKLDGVIIATPWLWHTRMSVAAMKAGVRAGVEVSAANTLQECWDLVNVYEETGTPLMILENVCYRRDVMAVLNMVREGLFGELLHGRCGYCHDLRGVKFNNGVEFGKKARGEARWRTEHSLRRNGDLYPTHGLGPIATMMDINRGNLFLSLTAAATKSRSLHEYIVEHEKGGEDHPNAKLLWKLGDVVTSTITTARGETIIVTHDTNSPRPYSLDFRVQGTDGLTDFDQDRRRVYIEGKAKKAHQWDDAKEWLEKYDHPLWRKYESKATGSGHGGMDFFVDNAFVESVKRQDDPPLDAYDAAAWSAVTPLSERSILANGEQQDFPDFTRGVWMKRKPIFALGDDY
jgi:predicted dehydrogenase